MNGMIKFRKRIGLAVRKFFRERQNKRLLKQINRVYKDEPDYAELELAKRMKSRYRKIIEGQW